MNLAVFIAKRYIVSKKSNNAINIISWISVVAVAVGTGALIIVLSGMNGLTKLVENLYSSFDPDIEITASKGKVFLPDSTANEKIKKIKGVKYLCYSIEDNALLKYNDKQAIATVKGVSKEFINISRFDTLVYEGTFTTKKDNAFYGVFGKGLAFRIGVDLKDMFSPLSIYSPKRGKVESLNPEDAFEEIKVYPSGLFSINDEFDFKYLLTDISAARQLFGYEKEVSAIELGCDANISIVDIQTQVQNILGDKFIIKTKYQQNEVLFKTLQVEKLWAFIILVFILIIGTFNIIGALTMLIIEKKKDISILNNMGADAGLIRKIFMTEGFLITILGAFIGLMLGLLTCWLQQQFGLIRFNEGYVIEAYPIDIRMSDFIAIISVVMLIGFFAAWYPVRIFTNKSIVNR